VQALALQSQSAFTDGWLEQLAAGQPYRRFLFLLVEAARPEAALEIGVDEGECSALMAAACVGTRVFGVDPRKLAAGSPARMYANFRFLWCDSLGALPVVRKLLDGRSVGVVLQDSSHHAEPSRLEWEYYRPLLAPEFAWVCDDVTPAFRMGDEPLGMEGYFDALPGTKLKFPELHVGNVIGVVLP
jgi:hypothetical protein